MGEIQSISDLICNIKEVMKVYFYEKTILDNKFNEKSDKGHKHPISDVNNLSAQLANKSDINHTHDMYCAKSYVDENFAGIGHTHPIDSSITNSENPVMSKAIKSALELKSDSTHTHAIANSSSAGFLSVDMLNKLNGIQAQANKTVVDSSLSSTSTNPLQNKAIYTELNKRATLDIATDEKNGLMSTFMVNKLNNIEDGAKAKKRILGWQITSPADNTNQNLVVINQNTNLTMKLYNSEDGTLETGGVTFVPNLAIHYTVNGRNYTRSTGNDGKQAVVNIQLSPGEYPMYLSFHGSGNYYPTYRTILLRVI